MMSNNKQPVQSELETSIQQPEIDRLLKSFSKNNKVRGFLNFNKFPMDPVTRQIAEEIISKIDSMAPHLPNNFKTYDALVCGLGFSLWLFSCNGYNTTDISHRLEDESIRHRPEEKPPEPGTPEYDSWYSSNIA